MIHVVNVSWDLHVLPALAEVKIVGTKAIEMDEWPLNLSLNTDVKRKNKRKRVFLVDFNQIDRLSNHQKIRIEPKKEEDEEEKKKKKTSDHYFFFFISRFSFSFSSSTYLLPLHLPFPPHICWRENGVLVWDLSEGDQQDPRITFPRPSNSVGAQGFWRENLICWKDKRWL